jgi:hypothetical protein
VDVDWQHEDRTPTHGYAATREAAMTAFAKSWAARDLRTAPTIRQNVMARSHSMGWFFGR